MVDLRRHAMGQGQSGPKCARTPAVRGQQPFIQKIENVILAADDVQNLRRPAGGRYLGDLGGGPEFRPGQQDHAADHAWGKQGQGGQRHAGTKAVGDDVDRACAKRR